MVFNYNYIIYIIIICLFLYIIYSNITYNTYINQNNQNYLNGYWTSDSNFSKISDIDEMILNIDSEDSTGFLVIIIDNEINDNYEFIFKINKETNNKNYNEFEIEFLSDDENFIWDEKKFNAILSINDGTLKLFHNDTLFADLIKDNKMTQILK